MKGGESHLAGGVRPYLRGVVVGVTGTVVLTAIMTFGGGNRGAFFRFLLDYLFLGLAGGLALGCVLARARTRRQHHAALIGFLLAAPVAVLASGIGQMMLPLPLTIIVFGVPVLAVGAGVGHLLAGAPAAPKGPTPVGEATPEAPKAPTPVGDAVPALARVTGRAARAARMVFLGVSAIGVATPWVVGGFFYLHSESTGERTAGLAHHFISSPGNLLFTLSVTFLLAAPYVLLGRMGANALGHPDGALGLRPGEVPAVLTGALTCGLPAFVWLLTEMDFQVLALLFEVPLVWAVVGTAMGIGGALGWLAANVYAKLRRRNRLGPD